MKGAFSAGSLKWGVIAAAKADEKKKRKQSPRARQKPTGSINAINPENAAVLHDIVKTKTDRVYKKWPLNIKRRRSGVFSDRSHTYFFDIGNIIQGSQCLNDLAVFFILFQLLIAYGKRNRVNAEAGIEVSRI